MEYHSIDRNGTPIYYHVRGSGDPLVLLMGFGADGTVWEKHAAVYEKYFRCIILDNRGVGRSGQPAGPYTTAMMAEDTAAVMTHAGVASAAVAGISMGGAIAQQLALLYPEKVKRLLLVSTWAKFNAYASAVYQNLKHVRAEVNAAYFTELLQLWIFAPPYYEKHSDSLKAAASASVKNANPQTRNGFEGQLDACIHHDTVSRLSSIKVPTLITVGKMDIFTPPEFSEIIHNKISGSILSFYPDAGHVHHWEDLERFNSETLTFLLNKKV